jgi:hypothetical protein
MVGTFRKKIQQTFPTPLAGVNSEIRIFIKVINRIATAFNELPVLLEEISDDSKR